MKTDKRIRDLLILYDSDELTASERQYVEEQLASNQDYRSELEEIRQLHATMRSVADHHPELESLPGLRARLSERLQREQDRVRWWQKIAAALAEFELRPVIRYSVIAAALFAGILVGRHLLPSSQDAAPSHDLLGRLLSEQTIVSKSASIAPYLRHISRIRHNPETAEVEVQFSTAQDVFYKGTVDDPMVHRLLAQAMLAGEQTGIKLKAVKAANTTFARGDERQNDNLMDALVYLLANDPNTGVRLKVVQVLKHSPRSDKAKHALIKSLLQDTNPAIRLAALEALSQYVESDAAATIEAVANHDTSRYLRFQAQELLDVNQQQERLR